MTYSDRIEEIIMSGESMGSFVANNLGIAFFGLLLVVIYGLAVRQGIKSGIIFYFISILTTIVAVSIGAIPSTYLLYLSLPLLVILLIKMIFKGEEET